MRAGIRLYFAIVVAVFGVMIAPDAVSAQVQLSDHASRILQREGLITSYIGGVAGLAKEVRIGPDSRPDRSAMLAACEAVLEKDRQSVAAQFGYDQALMKSTNILASAVDVLNRARVSPEGAKEIDWFLARGDLVDPRSGGGSIFGCFLREARGLVAKRPQSSAVTARTVVAPPQGGVGAGRAAGAITVDPALIARAARDREVARLGLPTVNALDEVLAVGAGPATTRMPVMDSMALSWGDPATEQAKRDYSLAQQQYTQSKQRKVHNQANDATSCIRVEPTGVRSEWGMEGRYRLLNTCGHPIEASWCANERECSAGRGNLWTIQPGKAWPIFFAGSPIQVGACKAGAAKQPPLGEQGVERTGFSEARQAPAPAAGVSLLPGHRCD